MTLRYANGLTVEAVLLSRTEGKMRVALKGSDDVVELRELSGTWVTDDCEPVQVSFAWQNAAPAPTSEEECICPPELAARLIQLLMSADEAEEGSQTSAPATLRVAAAPLRVV